MSEPTQAITTRALPTDAERAEALRQVNRSRGMRWRVFWEWTKSFTIAVGLFLIVRAFLVEAFKIPSGSMERTLLVGDFLLVNKMIYGAEIPLTPYHLPALRQPRRGDVVVFVWPEDHTKNFVKRLVGLPGDTLEMRDGVLYIEGVPQRERYITRTEPDIDPSGEEFRWQRNYLIRSAEASVAYHPSRNNWGPLIVPEDNYFVLGDNRDNSLDSRYWGFVPASLMRGRPMFVYYSFAPDSAQKLPWITNIRWSRIGALVR